MDMRLEYRGVFSLVGGSTKMDWSVIARLSRADQIRRMPSRPVLLVLLSAWSNRFEPTEERKHKHERQNVIKVSQTNLCVELLGRRL